MADMPMPMQGEQKEMPQQGQGGATELVTMISDNMMQLLGGLTRVQEIPQESKQKLAAIIQAFQQFVEQDLGSGGAPKAAPKRQPAGGVTTPEAGAAEVEPA